MPTATQHADKIARNKAFVSFLDASTPAFPGWAVTAIFYTAVRHVERYLYVKAQQTHCTSHNQRSRFFGRIPDLKAIGKEYYELKNKSEDARYRAVNITTADVADAEALLHTIEAHFAQCLP